MIGFTIRFICVIWFICIFQCTGILQMSEKIFKNPQFIQNVNSPCISLTLSCLELSQHAFLYITVSCVIIFFKYNFRSFFILKKLSDLIYASELFLILASCQKFLKLLCAALFPRSFVDGIIALCVWFPFLVKICFSAAFPLCPSTTSSLLFPLFCAAGYPDGFLQMLCILCTNSIHQNTISFPYKSEHLSSFQLFISVKGFLTAIPCNSGQSDSIQYV